MFTRIPDWGKGKNSVMKQYLSNDIDIIVSDDEASCGRAGDVCGYWEGGEDVGMGTESEDRGGGEEGGGVVSGK